MNINKSDGWVKLHKSVLDSDLWRDYNGWRVFTTLLLMAHHEDNMGSVRLKGKQVYLKKGQLEISRSELSEFLDMSQSTVRNALTRLKDDGRVDITSDNHNTIISICNWEKFQSQKDNQRTTGGQLEDSRPLSQKNKRNKEYNVETQKVYDHYIKKFNKNPNLFKLTDSRKSKITKRLEDAGFEMLTRAIDNVASSKFYNGENDRGWKADLDFITRNYEQVEKLSEMGTAKSANDWFREAVGK